MGKSFCFPSSLSLLFFVPFYLLFHLSSFIFLSFFSPSLAFVFLAFILLSIIFPPFLAHVNLAFLYLSYCSFLKSFSASHLYLLSLNHSLCLSYHFFSFHLFFRDVILLFKLSSSLLFFLMLLLISLSFYHL